jgi:outer membrane protein assembly factor BamB
MAARIQFFLLFTTSSFRSSLCAFAPLRETLLCLLVFACYAQAENWERFRGPNGAGQSDDTSIPSKWEPEHFVWKQTLPGVGHSSPVIWENNLYLISADAETGAQIVSAFNVHTGAPIWDKKLDASTYRVHKLNSLASSTPAADADHVYVLWLADGEVSLATFTHAGEERWRRSIGPFKEQHGFGISPVVVDDVVCVARDSGADSSIAAFDRNSGEPRWNLPVEPNNTAFATPCLLDPKANPKILLASNTSLGLAAIDASCGKVVWQGFENELDQRCVASPIIADGKIFVGCGQGGRGKLLLAVQPGNESSPPQEIYRVSQNAPQVPTPVVAGDLLFIWSDRGIVSCFDVVTGKRHWMERIGGDFHSSPVAIGNRIFGFSRQGDVIVLAADKEFKELARNTLDEPVVATPAVANRRLYVRTLETLYCIGDAKK